MSPDHADRTAKADRSDFYERAAGANLAPLWRVLHGLVAEKPTSPALPAFWAYDCVRAHLKHALGDECAAATLARSARPRGMGRSGRLSTPACELGLGHIRPSPTGAGHTVRRISGAILRPSFPQQPVSRAFTTDSRCHPVHVEARECRATMGSDVVVVEPPAFHENAGFGQVGEDLRVQALAAQAIFG